MAEKSGGVRKSAETDNGFEGGYMTVKKQKLEQQVINQKAAIGLENYLGFDLDGCTTLFKGVSIFVNGYTKPPSDELKRLVLACGGNYNHYYSPKTTTHIIATNLPYVKQQKIRDEKVVLPGWLTDSIRAKRLLPLDSYYLILPTSLRLRNTLLNYVGKNGSTSVASSTVSRNPEADKLEENPVTSTTSASPKIILTPSKKRYPNQEQHYSHHNNHNGLVVSSSRDFPTVEKLPGFSKASAAVSPSSAVSTSAINGLNGLSHNSEAKNVSRTATDPDFVREFFNRSRLHHISTAGNDLKVYVRNLVENHCGNFDGLERLKAAPPEEDQIPASPVIMIIDMDCFFVSVALKKRPDLRGKPVAVTHSRAGKGTPKSPNCDVQGKLNEEVESCEKFEDLFEATEELFSDFDGLVPNCDYKSGSTSEVASCSYEARSFGVHAGMYVGRAMQLCPQLITVPYEFEEYSAISKILYDVVASYTLKIEAVSCDEMFVDVTDVLRKARIGPLTLASAIRKDIESRTGGCTASAGLASNVLLAKLALKACKPNGQMYLVDDSVVIQEFMSKLKVEDLPGIGYSVGARLKEVFGTQNCSELQQIPIARLQAEFGEKSGKKIHECSLGVDRTELKFYDVTDRKSVSATINYGIRFKNSSQVDRFLSDLTKEVVSRLSRIGAKGKQITLKLLIRSKGAAIEPTKYLGCGVCDSVCKSSTLRVATNNPGAIISEITALFKSVKCNIEDLRGVGIQMGKLEFDNPHTSCRNTEASIENPNKNLLNYFSHGNSPTKEDCPSYNPPNGSSVHITPILANALQRERSDARINANTSPSFASLPSSMSMIDKDVLDALPEEIRREVIQSYSFAPVTASHIPAQPAQQAKVKPKTGQKKSKKGFKSAKSKARKSEKTLDEIFNAIKTGETRMNLLDVRMSNKAHICGKVDTNSVVSLIEEWVTKEEELLDEDVAYVTNYCFNLLEEKNYERLKTVIDSLQNFIVKRNTKEWSLAYNEIMKALIAEMQDEDFQQVPINDMQLLQITED